MDYAAAEWKKEEVTGDALKLAEYVSKPINLIDHSGKRHVFRKFCLLGHWGVCNLDCTEMLIPPQDTYSTVEFLVYTRLIVLGNSDIGWDIYSLDGELVDSLPAMPIARVSMEVNAKKRSNQ